MEEITAQTVIDDSAQWEGELTQGVYRHYTGGLYRVHALAYDEATLVPTVVYEQLLQTESFPHRSFWTRSLKEFFGPVHLPSGEVVRRFSLEQNLAHWLS